MDTSIVEVEPGNMLMCNDNDYKDYYDKLILKYTYLDNIAISEIFGEAFTAPLWDFYTGDKNVPNITKELFLEKTPSLFLQSPEVFIKIFKNPRILLNACFLGAGVKAEECDDSIIDDIEEKMTFCNNTEESTLLWIHQNCPHICDQLQEFIIGKIKNIQPKSNNVYTNSLTSVQMFLLKSSLDKNLFFKTTENESNWFILYDSTLIFEHKLNNCDQLEEALIKYCKVKDDLSNVEEIQIWSYGNENNNLYFEKPLKRRYVKSCNTKCLEQCGDEIVISIGGRCGKITRRPSTSESV
uniref:BACK domain-containing protein n=1 Tax=Parastrongyloides trichosuri TaxID=131310 RepID=A0A0N4Z4R3_PARTI